MYLFTPLLITRTTLHPYNIKTNRCIETQSNASKTSNNNNSCRRSEVFSSLKILGERRFIAKWYSSGCVVSTCMCSLLLFKNYAYFHQTFKRLNRINLHRKRKMTVYQKKFLSFFNSSKCIFFFFF